MAGSRKKVSPVFPRLLTSLILFVGANLGASSALAQRADTVTSLTSFPNPSVVGQAVTLYSNGYGKRADADG